MQIQSQSAQYHTLPPTTQSPRPTNGVDPHAAPKHSEYSNGHTKSPAMNPYQQQHPQYAGGYDAYLPPHSQPQQPRSDYMQANHHPQLPPLVPNYPQNSMPGQGMVKDDAGLGLGGSMGALQPGLQPEYQPYGTSQHVLHPPSSLAQAKAGAGASTQEKRMSFSCERNGHRYALEVVQQPQRARMCGFGDKDRRPITPPPCVRLVITDIESGREIEVNEVQSDPAFFVLQVDLWSENADREASVVKASSSSPAVSISSATTTSYPPPAERPATMGQEGTMLVMTPTGPVYMPGYAMVGRPGMQYNPYDPASMGYAQMPNQAMYPPPAQSSSAMYQRNLIGSLSVNASRLTDDQGKLGYWFVLQDLSVRTEGMFRLRMSFVDISNHAGAGVNKGKAGVLAWTFSHAFQVYSAKKFPGVIESTPLSKIFASQGIKIPIRKDNKGEGGDDDDGD